MTEPAGSAGSTGSTGPGAPGRPSAVGAPGAGTRATRSSVRRVDPTGKHALFSAPPTAARDQLGPGNRKEGRDAFFSTGPRQPGTVVVTCSQCATRSRVTLLDLGLRLLSISVWIPGRKHNHWMRCPGCHQHTWCDIGWNE